MTLPRRLLVALLLLLTTQAKSAPPQPNILIILADDMGFSDPTCYGGEIETPNLDALASNGLRFTQFYNTARCWPSRASLMTGYYAQAVHRDALSNIPREPGDPPPGGVKGIRPPWAQLMSAYLKPLGYRTYHSGKWHLDGQPLDNGFDHSYTNLSEDYHLSAPNHAEDGKKLPPILADGKFCTTTYMADYAIKYLKDHADNYPHQPFFEYLAFHCPHFPVQALPEDIALYKGRYKAGWDAIRIDRLARMKKLGLVNCDLSDLEPQTIPSWNLSEEILHQKIGPNEIARAVPWDTLTAAQKDFQAAKMAVHAAMVHRMDIEIGRVIAQLKSMNAFDNTVIFFLSDNGASAEQMIRGAGHDPTAPIGSEKSFVCIGPGWSTAANTPFRLHKSWVHEGGITTPLIVHWPAGIKTPNELRTDPTHLIDLLPTVLDLAQAKPPTPLPGLSLTPDFPSDHHVTHDHLWWNHEGNRALRIGSWKLVADHQSPWELYDLSTDRSESHNLASSNPDRVHDMEQAWTREALHQRDLAR